MGHPVYAASFVRQRRVVLETDLLGNRPLLQFILIHELFHFVWVRLANSKRSAFSNVLRLECGARARGELGESADVSKSYLKTPDFLNETRRWREYVCESFCDTAAWVFSSLHNDAVTLAERHRKRRAMWFKTTFAENCQC